MRASAARRSRAAACADGLQRGSLLRAAGDDAVDRLTRDPRRGLIRAMLDVTYG